MFITTNLQTTVTIALKLLQVWMAKKKTIWYELIIPKLDPLATILGVNVPLRENSSNYYQNYELFRH